ncbi:type II toxin-antitoxin system Phd/YefM family antitoxin [[Phormidium] sp. ETS-05]|uniref:type II toxin-antitoxin system Phd/YefM family antitoxin n=1 Tax=[Phormidium] sp. ETS-05 TaxID=222819 RepID=UPI0018EF2A6D|nr:DUF2281 domain-containing protein [[Phormidium] sp. ETS-05]
MTVDINDRKISLEELIKMAIGGEEVILTKDNQPVAQIVPLTTEEKTWPAQAGSAKGMVWMADDFDAPLEEFRDYM